MDLTVCCVLKSGGGFYTSHVTELHKMVKDNLNIPFEFVCLTDLDQSNFPKYIKAVPFEVDFPWKWCKINIWNPNNPFRDRILFLDLDSIVMRNLEPIVNFKADFALVRQWKNIGPRFGRKRILRYKSPLMVWNHNTRPQLWNNFYLGVMNELVGDQDWIGKCCPKEKLFPDGWFDEERYYNKKGKKVPEKCIVLGVTNHDKDINSARRKINA